jgi:hypothetical protein
MEEEKNRNPLFFQSKSFVSSMEEGGVTRPSRGRRATPRDKPPDSKPGLVYVLHLKKRERQKGTGAYKLQIALDKKQEVEIQGNVVTFSQGMV